MRFTLDAKTFVIHEVPLKTLERFSQTNSQAPEAGGIVLGKIFKDRIDILKLSTPTILDKASRHNFERHKLSAQIVIDYEFYNSGGQMNYLGEWHTHPEPIPIPSGTDINMLRQQFTFNIINTDFLILIIKGTNKLYVRLISKKGICEMIL